FNALGEPLSHSVGQPERRRPEHGTGSVRIDAEAAPGPPTCRRLARAQDSLQYIRGALLLLRRAHQSGRPDRVQPHLEIDTVEERTGEPVEVGPPSRR